MSDDSKYPPSPYDKKGTTNPWRFAIYIGFFAGLIWGMIRWVCYALKFTTIIPGFIAEPFFLSSFLRTGWGMAVGIASYIIFSIIASLIYMALLRRLRGPWPGVGYGFVWWAILFAGLGPLMGMMNNLWTAGWNTLYTELCISLLWGVFIGYSITFEFTDEASREPMKKTILAK